MNEFETIHYSENDVELDVKITSNGTAWLTKEDLAKLFGKDRSVISRHIKSALSEGVLDSVSVCAKYAHTGPDGKVYQVDHYSLDLALEIGRRVRSSNAALLKAFLDERLGERSVRNDIVIYDNGDVSIDVRVSPSEDTVWLTQSQMAELFGVTVKNVSSHIKNILAEGELTNSVIQKYFITASDGKVYETLSYNLDMILSVGYRVKSKKAIEFRRWATKVLKSCLIKGHALDESRLLSAKGSFHELSLRVLSLENQLDTDSKRLSKLEDKVEQALEPNPVFFAKDHYFDARLFISDLFEQASKSILLVDPYADAKALSLLLGKKKEVVVTLLRTDRSRLTQEDIDAFNRQYGGLTVQTIDGDHDRFILIDDARLYHVGTSINHMGKGFFVVSKISKPEFVSIIKDILLRGVRTETNE